LFFKSKHALDAYTLKAQKIPSQVHSSLSANDSQFCQWITQVNYFAKADVHYILKKKTELPELPI